MLQRVHVEHHEQPDSRCEKQGVDRVRYDLCCANLMQVGSARLPISSQQEPNNCQRGERYVNILDNQIHTSRLWLLLETRQSVRVPTYGIDRGIWQGAELIGSYQVAIHTCDEHFVPFLRPPP